MNMLTEDQLVPYQSAELPPAPWLVFAPHPDDEAFGMGGSISLATSRGMAVDLVVVTDGALGGEQHDLAATRAREARQAAAILGIGNIHFMAQPDRGLRCSRELVQETAALIRQAAPRTVFFPGVMELHPDHRVTTALVWQALASLHGSGIRPASYEISVQGPVNALIDITDSVNTKIEALARYGSQLQQNNYQDVVLGLNRSRTFTLPPQVQYAEGYYLFEPGEILQDLENIFVERLKKQFILGT